VRSVELERAVTSCNQTPTAAASVKTIESVGDEALLIGHHNDVSRAKLVHRYLDDANLVTLPEERAHAVASHRQVRYLPATHRLPQEFCQIVRADPSRFFGLALICRKK
jgi:hypothetical protein